MPDRTAADYEALRRVVLDGVRGGRDLGLVLLIRRGMGASVEREVRDDLFELGVFVAQPSQLLQPEPTELLLPPIEHLFSDPEPPTNFSDLFAAFDLVQSVDDPCVASLRLPGRRRRPA